MTRRNIVIDLIWEIWETAKLQRVPNSVEYKLQLHHLIIVHNMLTFYYWSLPTSVSVFSGKLKLLPWKLVTCGKMLFLVVLDNIPHSTEYSTFVSNFWICQRTPQLQCFWLFQIIMRQHYTVRFFWLVPIRIVEYHTCSAADWFQYSYNVFNWL